MRRALLVGIDTYTHAEHLKSCVSDVEALEILLERDDDKSPNFKCEKLVSSDGAVTTALLRERLEATFVEYDGDVLFYFSGHGTATSMGGHLMTHESSRFEPGLPMRDLVRYANLLAGRGRHKVTIILDCCYAGAACNDDEVVGSLDNEADLLEGVTILAAAKPRQRAVESGRHGMFTRLVLGALQGGAADVRGQVSAAAVYAYAEAILGALDQRPIYKSHAASLEPIRRCHADVSDDDLRALTKLFPSSDSEHQLDPSYEFTEVSADPEKVSSFKILKRLQTARLVRCDSGPDLYYVALRSETARLTPLGRFYWELAAAREI